MLAIRTILMLSMLASIATIRTASVMFGEAQASARCDIVKAEIRKLRVLEADLLQELKKTADGAQELGERLGREAYRPYVDTLKNQQEQLKAQLGEFEQSLCRSSR
jgi:hypothetical protein